MGTRFWCLAACRTGRLTNGRVWVEYGRPFVMETLTMLFGGVMSTLFPARLLLGLLVLLLTAGCATTGAPATAEPGGPDNPGAALWYTLVVAAVAFVVGFLVAATTALNGGIRITSHRHRHMRRTEAGWERVSRRIEAGTRRGLAEWRSAGHAEDPDWEDLSRRIEQRILDEMRKHHD